VGSLAATAVVVATVTTIVLGAAFVESITRSSAANGAKHSADAAPTPTSSTAPTTTTDPRVAPLPVASAPYAVGVTHVSFTDTTRGTDARGDTPASSSRTIAVTVRYPIAGAAGDDETAGVAAVRGSFPLLVFAHGDDVSADTYARLEHQLASAGFVVVAPDFPLTSSALPGPAIEDDVVNQAADVSFVISSMLDPSRAPVQVLDVADRGPVGVVGHSDGGVTAAAVAYNSTVADPRVGAAVVLSGAEARYDGTWFTTQSPPLLAVHGTADEVNPFDSSTTLYDGATGPAMLVAVQGGSHLGPFTTDDDEPAVAALAADFLLAHLEGDAAASARLATDVGGGGALSLVASSPGP
jgi:fermentation-respiration switch protein FrsA (DUF1100 family)